MSRSVGHSARSLVPLALFLGASCGPPPPPRVEGPRDAIVEALSIDTTALAPDLAAALRHDPHHYFRYVSNRFVGVECQVANEGPTVNLHGDAHLEQYVVSTLGRGLGDFDEATTGPVGIDLVRLATSLQLAARMRGWDAEALTRRFLEGYLRALEEPAYEAPDPRWAAVARARFDRDHEALLAWSDSLMEPLPPAAAARVEVAFGAFVEGLARHRPALDPHAFEIVRLGTHSLGVGSRRGTKYLLRVRGPTEDPADDWILEAKEVAQNPFASCLPIARAPDPLRVLVAEARLAYSPFRDVGYIEIDGTPFWVHEWVDDYVELSVEDPSVDEAALAEVVFDIGVQLGRGHPRALRDPYEEELRRAIIRFVVRRADALFAESARLADAVWIAWERSTGAAAR